MLVLLQPLFCFFFCLLVFARFFRVFRFRNSFSPSPLSRILLPCAQGLPLSQIVELYWLSWLLITSFLSPFCLDKLYPFPTPREWVFSFPFRVPHRLFSRPSCPPETPLPFFLNDCYGLLIFIFLSFFSVSSNPYDPTMLRAELRPIRPLTPPRRLGGLIPPKD